MQLTIPVNNFDAYSQLYSGISTSNENQIINALVSDNSLEYLAQEPLTKIYLQMGIYGALKLAENEAFQKR